MTRVVGSMAVLSVLSVCASPELASACSAPYCATPVALVLPSSGVVPANLGELTTYEPNPPWFPPPADVRVWEASDPDRVLFQGSTESKAGKVSIPIGPLTEGKSYVAEVTPNCQAVPDENKPSRQFPFRVGAVSPLPSGLGPLALVQSGNTMVPWGAGAGCWDLFKADAAELKLDADALPEPWRELVSQYELMVDGEPFSWPLTIGGYGPTAAPRAFYGAKPGVFQVWTACGVLPAHTSSSEQPKGVMPGKHTVWVRARLPSTQPTYLESERVEVDLSCNTLPVLPPQSPPEEVDAGTPVSPDPGADPVPAADAKDTAEDTEAQAAPERDVDAGCSVGSRGAARSGLLAVLGVSMFAALLRARRSRRARA